MRAVLMALLGALLACGTEPATQTLVLVHADPGLASGADRLRITVVSGGEVVQDPRTDPVDRSVALLATLPLVPRDGRAERSWEVLAELLEGDIVRATLRVGGGYEAGALREIRVWFDADPECATIGDCGEGRTCVAGRCLGACFEASLDERDRPACGECEACVDGACRPRGDGSACGCAGDTCRSGACEPSVVVTNAWAGEHQTCARTSEGFWCWGHNHAGRVGLPSGQHTDAPVPITDALSTWSETPRSLIDMAMGADHSCLLWARPGPEFQRTCWGWNGGGATGLGTTDDGVAEPTDAPDGDPVWLELTGGRFHTCGLDDGGRILCWGSGDRGQRGVAGMGETGDPAPLDDRMDWTDVDAGQELTCGVRVGRVECVGAGLGGQLGDGERTDRGEPRCVVDDAGECLEGFTQVSAGSGEVCALHENGEAWCWGNNENGKLGVEGGDIVTRPRRVMTDVRFRELSVGIGFVCGIDVDGGLWCWGGNRSSSGFGGGVLGVGDLESRDRPTRVAVDPGDRWRTIDAAFGYACGVRENGDLYCWGSNDFNSTAIGEAAGRLGLGWGTDLDDEATRRDALVPRRVCFED